MLHCGLDIPIPKVLAEIEPVREIEYQIKVRPRLATWRRNGRTKLNPFGSCLIRSKTDAQPFALPAARYRQDDVGESGCRREVEIRLDVKFKAVKRFRASSCIGVRQKQVGAESSGKVQ